MKNLRLVSHIHHEVAGVLGSRHLAINYDDGTVYAATDRHITAVNPVTGKVT